ncbi:ROK family protein, partial [Bifidobacterium pullorum]|uniref:ROK family protein n=1 Tax=Bifidobacterium pullorum TaxID=78448 RepID=UPI00388D9301
MAALRRINQDDLRNHNLSVVIDTLLRTTEPLSRAELAKRTGLTKATMSLLVSMLVDDGVVREGEPSVQSSYGRPSTPLLIAGGRYCGIGLQVNTNGYGVIVLDLDGTVISERWVDADMSAPDADEVFAELDALAMEQEALLAERGYTVAGAGLALPGLVTGDMRLLMARNLGWEQLDLTRFDVMRRLDVTAGNEANMAALAQIPGYAMRRDGDGIVGPSESFIYLSTDVGIGGAVVRNGHVEIGDHGFGGELGHTSVELRGPVCRCGRRGCLETYAGRRAMVESAGIASGSAAARRESVAALIDRGCAGAVRVAA